MRQLRIIALAVGLVPALASAAIVERVYGLGNVHEPMAACGTDGCQVIEYIGPQVGGACPVGNKGSNDMFPPAGPPCVRQGPDELLSSVIQIQNDIALGTDPVPGAIRVVEDTVAGTVRIPAGSNSGFHNRVTLNLEIFGDTYIIPSAIRFRFDGATGTGSPTTQIVWDQPAPYILEGCLICVSGSGDGCADILLGPPAGGVEGDPICNALIQPGDPRLRDMPNWISDDGGDTWHFPSNEDGFYSAAFTSAGTQNGGPLESIYTDYRDLGLAQDNGGAWILRGFLGRECGTMNLHSRDAFIPSAGKPDPDCDGDADWRYGTGGFSEPLCLNNGDPGQPIFAPPGLANAVGCQSLLDAGPDLDGTPGPPIQCDPGEGANTTLASCALPSPDTLLSSFLTVQRDLGHPLWASKATIDIEEDPSGNPGNVKWCTGSSLVCAVDADCRQCEPVTRVCAQGLCRLQTALGQVMRDSEGNAQTCTLPLDDSECLDYTAETPRVPRECSASQALCSTDGDCIDSVCEEVGTVRIPAGSQSGYTTSQILDLDVLGQHLVITTSGRTFLDGATGLGSPGDTIVWNNPVPWTVTTGGCYYCESTPSPTGCADIALVNDGFITCNQAQFGDPGIRVMPSWASTDLGQTWKFARLNGDANDDNIGHWDPGTESIQAGAGEQGTSGNRGPVLFFGYRDHDCGTMNDPGRGLTAPGTCRRVADGTFTSGCFDTVNSSDCRADRPQTPTVNERELCIAGVTGPYGNPFNPSHAKSDMDCDRKIDPGIYPLESDINDPEFPNPIPLPSDLVQDRCVSRLDKCCGDQNGDGVVTVSDLTAINIAIFNPALETQLCDANNDSLCSVSDLVFTNIQLFNAHTTATCAYNTRVYDPTP